MTPEMIQQLNEIKATWDSIPDGRILGALFAFTLTIGGLAAILAVPMALLGYFDKKKDKPSSL